MSAAPRTTGGQIEAEQSRAEQSRAEMMGCTGCMGCMECKDPYIRTTALSSSVCARTCTNPASVKAAALFQGSNVNVPKFQSFCLCPVS